MGRFYENYELNDAEIVKAIHKAASDYEDGAILEAADTLAEIVYAIKQYSDDEPLVHGEELANIARSYGAECSGNETDRQLKHSILDAMKSVEARQ